MSEQSQQQPVPQQSQQQPVPQAHFGNLYLIAKIAGILIACVFGAYVISFWGELPSKTSGWGEFGDYFGGTLNPLLSFMGLIALLRTLALQSKQLALSAEAIEQSKNELTLTRQELQRTARAQEFSAKLQEGQAKHAEITTKLNGLSLSLPLIDEMLNRLEKTRPDLWTDDDRKNFLMMTEMRSTQMTQIVTTVIDLCGTQIQAQR